MEKTEITFAEDTFMPTWVLSVYKDVAPDADTAEAVLPYMAIHRVNEFRFDRVNEAGIHTVLVCNPRTEQVYVEEEAPEAFYGRYFSAGNEVYAAYDKKQRVFTVNVMTEPDRYLQIEVFRLKYEGNHFRLIVDAEACRWVLCYIMRPAYVLAENRYP